MQKINSKDYKIQFTRISPIVSGKCNPRQIVSIPTKTLSNTLKKLIKFGQIRNFIENPTTTTKSPPEWWPTQQPFYTNWDNQKTKYKHGSRREFMQYLITHCMTFYKQTPVDVEDFERKKAFFIVALNSEKRPGSKSIEIAQKRAVKCYKKFVERRKYSRPRKNDNRPKLLNYFPIINSDQISTKIEQSLRNKKNVIKLKDMLKYKSVVVRLKNKLTPSAMEEMNKLEYMHMLNLTTRESCFTSKQSTPPLESEKYCSTIPFSSNLGKYLIDRNRYKISTEMCRTCTPVTVALSRGDIDEYFLNKYNFSECRVMLKQLKQRLQNRTKIIYCRPVTVVLSRADIDEYFLKKYNFTECRVVLKQLKQC